MCGWQSCLQGLVQAIGKDRCDPSCWLGQDKRDAGCSSRCSLEVYTGCGKGVCEDGNALESIDDLTDLRTRTMTELAEATTRCSSLLRAWCDVRIDALC